MRSNNSRLDEIARDSNEVDLERSKQAPCSKSYSDGIVIVHEGPSRNYVCTSFVEYGETARNYKESVRLVLRMVPHLYCTTLVVEEVRAQEDPEQRRVYFQEIRLKPKWVTRDFEETVYNYPKEALKRYVSTMTYDSDSRPRTFVSGLTVCAPCNSADLGQLLTPPPSPEVFQNGTDETRDTLPSHIGYGSTKVKLEFDQNSNFSATKDIAVNGV